MIRTTRRPKSFAEAVAFHEAGHAVAAWALHRGVRQASIIRTASYEGMVRYCRRSPLWWIRVEKVGLASRWGGHIDARTRNAVEDEIMIALAGGLTEMEVFGLKRHEVGMGVVRLSRKQTAYMAKQAGQKTLIGNHYKIEGDDSDYGIARGLAMALLGNDRQAVRPYLNWLEWRTKRLIQRPDFVPTVEAVAQALQAHRQLSGRELGEIIRESQASWGRLPLVDGNYYYYYDDDIYYDDDV